MLKTYQIAVMDEKTGLWKLWAHGARVTKPEYENYINQGMFRGRHKLLPCGKVAYFERAE